MIKKILTILLLPIALAILIIVGILADKKFQEELSEVTLGADTGASYAYSGTNISTGVDWTNPGNVARVEFLHQIQNASSSRLGIAPDTDIAMVFTPTTTGHITKFSLYLNPGATLTGTSTFSILGTDGGVPSSTMVYATSTYPSLTGGWFDVDFSSARLELASGTQYALNFEKVSTSTSLWDTFRGDNYLNGKAYRNRKTTTGWEVLLLSGLEADAMFRLYLKPSPDDGQNATISGLGTTGGPGAASKLLAATNFGFSVPNDATIDGIEVTVEASQSNCTNQVLWLTKDGSTTAGVVKTPSFTGSISAVTFGGSSDLWSTTWTASEINASTFGAAFGLARLLTTPACSGAVDYMTVAVYYTEAGPEPEARVQRIIIIN